MSKEKKGKDFKQVIMEEKQKGKTFKKIMKAITGVTSSVMYAFVFLLIFVTLDVAVYVLFSPEVFVWAGILVGVALVSSVVSSRVTNLLKKQQWKYASE
jgi:uncharacterized membrane protein